MARTTTEHVAVMIGKDRKLEILALSQKTGINMSSLIRSWIFERLDQEKAAN